MGVGVHLGPGWGLFTFTDLLSDIKMCVTGCVTCDRQTETVSAAGVRFLEKHPMCRLASQHTGGRAGTGLRGGCLLRRLSRALRAIGTSLRAGMQNVLCFPLKAAILMFFVCVCPQNLMYPDWP